MKMTTASIQDLFMILNMLIAGAEVSISSVQSTKLRACKYTLPNSSKVGTNPVPRCKKVIGKDDTRENDYAFMRRR